MKRRTLPGWHANPNPIPNPIPSPSPSPSPSLNPDPDPKPGQGSWPHYERDVAFFNYWGNETAPATKYTAHIGSGVMFFNNNDRARNLLRAWAQAMAFPPNIHAPDDQVLDLLYSQGGWNRRASSLTFLTFP